MDLSSLETAAAISKHAVVLLTAGGVVAGYRAWHFAVKKDDTKRLQAQFAVVLLAALGAFAGYSVYYFTDEISMARERLAKEKEAEFERFRVEKSNEIASAGARAAEAIERALKLENANLVLRSQVATLEKAATDAGKELALLQAKTAKAVKRQEPRTFDKAIFLSRLATAPPGKIKIGYIQGVPEPGMLAHSLLLALREAKWDVLEFKPLVSVTDVGYTAVTEIFLMMRDLDNMSPSQKALLKALEEAGFQQVLSPIRVETVPADISVLWIGPKH